MHILVVNKVQILILKSKLYYIFFVGTKNVLLNFNVCFAIFLGVISIYMESVVPGDSTGLKLVFSCGKYSADFESKLGIVLHLFV